MPQETCLRAASIAAGLCEPEQVDAITAGLDEGASRTEVLRLRDGRLVEFQVHPRRVDDAPAGRVCSFRDVTELIATSEELARRGHQQNAILNGLSQVAIKYLGPDMRVKWANRAELDRMGATSEQVEGRLCHAVLYQQASPCDDCSAVEAYRTGQPAESEFSAADGRRFLVRSHPDIDEHGQVVGVIHATIDITRL